MPWLFFLAACAIPAFYAVGLVARTSDNFTTTEFWRFWVVHLWVEDFLELFTTVMVAYMFVLLGVVQGRITFHRDLPRHPPLLVRWRDRDDAPPLLLRGAGRAHGAGRVLFRRGGDPAHFPDRGGVVVPAARRGAGVALGDAVPARWAVMFLVAVGFWNFLGAGIFGFLINLPIVSYYEIGTALTANHGHAAMMGVYGMLALGLAMFCLRYQSRRTSGRSSGPGSPSGRPTSALPGCASRPCCRSGSSSSTSRSTRATSRPASSEFLTNDTNTVIEWLRLRATSSSSSAAQSSPSTSPTWASATR